MSLLNEAMNECMDDCCRPLVLGKRSSDDGDESCVASEDCAFGPIGFQRVRDVLPGEMIVITEEGKLQIHLKYDASIWARTCQNQADRCYVLGHL